MMQTMRAFVVSAVITAATTHPSMAQPRPPAQTKQGDTRVSALLEPIRQRHDLPALAGAIVTADGPLAVAAVGLRRYEIGPPVTVDDKFHIGSDTKAMTADLLATFVEAGAISWKTTLAEALPDLAASMLPAYRPVTISQLLAHRSGFIGETAAPGLSLNAMRASRLPLPEQRTRYLRLILAEPPANPPGSTFLYSNRNYIAAGAIAERLGRASWERLIEQRLFRPLRMATAGFGGMDLRGNAAQPWPHVLLDGRHVPVAPGPGADNPMLIGPAGTVHVSLPDWSRYVAFHLRAGKGDSPLLSPETFATFHAHPADGDSAFGWRFADRDWGGGTVLTHAGSNTMNYAVVWMAPRRGFAVLAATNQGGDAGRDACDEVSAALIELYRSTIALDGSRRP
jgi:CubicO group peptidase (beta-lactamase class C family)